MKALAGFAVAPSTSTGIEAASRQPLVVAPWQAATAKVARLQRQLRCHLFHQQPAKQAGHLSVSGVPYRSKVGTRQATVAATATATEQAASTVEELVMKVLPPPPPRKQAQANAAEMI